VLFAPGLGELAGDGGGEDGLAVALELGFGVAQGGDAGVEAGEEFLDPGDDAALFGEGRKWDFDVPYNSLTDVRLRSACSLLDQFTTMTEEIPSFPIVAP
jgi:hypothetical protein